MKNPKPLILSAVVACAAVVGLVPTIASADTGTAPAKSRACHWDRQTGRMICQRTSAPGGGDASPAPVTPPPPPPALSQPQQQPGEKSLLGAPP